MALAYFIKSIENQLFELDGVGFGDVNLTKGQDYLNCVPFHTFWGAGASVWARNYVYAYSLAGPKIHYIKGNTFGGTKSACAVVEFEPAYVKVQQTVFQSSQADSNSGLTSGSTAITEVDLSRTFILPNYQGCQSGEIWQDQNCQVFFDSPTKIRAVRTTNVADMKHHNVVVEALDWWIWDVAHLDFTLTGTEVLVDVPQDAPWLRKDNNTLIIATYRSTNNNNNPDEGCITADWSGGQIRIRRGSSNNEIYGKLQLVTSPYFNIQRGQVDFGTGDTDQTATINAVDEAVSFIWGTAPQGSRTIGNTNENQGMAYVLIQDPTTVAGQKYSAELATDGAFQVIETQGDSPDWGTTTTTTTNPYYVVVPDEDVPPENEYVQYWGDEEYWIAGVNASYSVEEWDFDGYTLDQQPSDWTRRDAYGEGSGENAPHFWTRSKTTPLVADKVLEVRSGGAHIMACSPDSVGQILDSEQLMLFTQSHIHSNGGAQLKARLIHTGGGHYKTSYNASLYNGNKLRLFRWVNVVPTQMAEIAFPYTVDTWYWMRYSVSGTNPVALKVKVWAHGTEEPEAWTLEHNDSTAPRIQSAGYVGPGDYNNIGMGPPYVDTDIAHYTVYDGGDWYYVDGPGGYIEEAGTWAADYRVGTKIRLEGYHEEGTPWEVTLRDNDLNIIATVTFPVSGSWQTVEADITWGADGSGGDINDIYMGAPTVGRIRNIEFLEPIAGWEKEGVNALEHWDGLDNGMDYGRQPPANDEDGIYGIDGAEELLGFEAPSFPGVAEGIRLRVRGKNAFDDGVTAEIYQGLNKLGDANISSFGHFYGNRLSAWIPIYKGDDELNNLRVKLTAEGDQVHTWISELQLELDNEGNELSTTTTTTTTTVTEPPFTGTTTTTTTTTSTTGTLPLSGTEGVVPNADVSCDGVQDTDANICPGDIYSDIDEGIYTPDNTTFARFLDAGATDITFGLTNPSFPGICTGIRVGMRSKTSTGTAPLDVGIYDGAVQIQSDQAVQQSTGEATRWTGQWTGFSYTAAELTNLRVKVRDDVQAGARWMYTLEVELTYGPLPTTTTTSTTTTTTTLPDWNPDLDFVFEVDVLVDIPADSLLSQRVGFDVEGEERPLGWKWDEMIWSQDQHRHSVVLPTLNDPDTATIPDDSWQSGIGHNLDLKVHEIVEDPGLGHPWRPLVRPGHYFIGEESFYLFSPNHVTRFGSSETLLDLSKIDLHYMPKQGVPLLVAFMHRDADGGVRDIDEFRKRVRFTGKTTTVVDASNNLVSRQEEVALDSDGEVINYNIGNLSNPPEPRGLEYVVMTRPEAFVSEWLEMSVGKGEAKLISITLSYVPVDGPTFHFSNGDIFKTYVADQIPVNEGEYSIGYSGSIVIPEGTVQVVTSDRDQLPGYTTYWRDFPATILFNDYYVHRIGFSEWGDPDPGFLPTEPDIDLVTTSDYLGESSALPNQLFYLSYFPMVDFDSLAVYVYDLRNDVVTEWTRVDDIEAAGPDDEVFTVSPDGGFILFGDGLAGKIPHIHAKIGACYDYVPYVQYMPEEDWKLIRPEEINLQPLFNATHRGFVYLSHKELTVDSLLLQTNRSRVADRADTYGPIDAGNDYALLTCTAFDKDGGSVPDIDISWGLDPSMGFINGTSPLYTRVETTTDSSGKTRVIYTPVRTAGDMGTIVNLFDGLGNPIDNITTTDIPNDTLLLVENVEADVTDIWLFMVLDDDPLQPYNPYTREGGRKVILYRYDETVADYVPVRPYSIINKNQLLFNYSLPTSDEYPALVQYTAIMDRVITVKASTINTLTGLLIESNPIKFYLNIPESQKGVYTLPTSESTEGATLDSAVYLTIDRLGGVQFLFNVATGTTTSTTTTTTTTAAGGDLYILPDGDVAGSYSTFPSGGGGYFRINSGIDSGTPNDLDGIAMLDGDWARFSFEAPSFAGTTTKIRVRFRAKSDGSDGVKVTLYSDGSASDGQSGNFFPSGSYSNFVEEYTIAKTAAQLVNLEVRFDDFSGSWDDYISEVEVEFVL